MSIQLERQVDLPTLDRHSVVPLYYQIQQHLLEQIRAGVLKPGNPTPSEQELSTRLRISRMTARQALKSLCDLGVTYSQRGKGTFVSAVKLEKNSRQVLSFSEEMQASGSKPRSKVLSFEVTNASPDVADVLHLSPDEKVISLRRVRRADSSPMGVEWSRLPVRVCPDLLQAFDPSRSLYQTLSERYGVHIVAADEVAEAGLADAEEAKLLRFAKGSPVFLFTRTSYARNEQPVEYVKSTYRGDRFKIVNRLTQPGLLRPDLSQKKKSVSREDAQGNAHRARPCS
ncbi:MAG: GntR family transcriptional regulator [Candidatus Sulfotelmatobacter sp.]